MEDNLRKSQVEHKIDEAYDTALLLGLDKASEFEKGVYRKLLNQIATAAIDEVRQDVTTLMGKASYKYTS